MRVFEESFLVSSNFFPDSNVVAQANTQLAIMNTTYNI